MQQCTNLPLAIQGQLYQESPRTWMNFLKANKQVKTLTLFETKYCNDY